MEHGEALVKAARDGFLSFRDPDNTALEFWAPRASAWAGAVDPE